MSEMNNNNQPTLVSDNPEKHFFRTSASDFKKIPGCPIAYWVSDRVFTIFSTFPCLGEIAEPKQGLASADNDRFLRLWFESTKEKTLFTSKSSEEAVYSKKKWFPIDKGGEFRRWYGNQTHVVDWEADGYSLRRFERSVIRNPKFYFKDGVTWTAISSSLLSVRHTGLGNIFSNAGMKVFAGNFDELMKIEGFLNSNVCRYLVSCISQTLNFDQGIIARLPIALDKISVKVIEDIEQIARKDWDSYETSWNFTDLPLLSFGHLNLNFHITYQTIRVNWQEVTLETQRLEQENNRIFIDAYGLQDELTSEVPLKEITLTCNPYYRYGNNKNEEELEALLLADTIKEFLSYAVGCMFGRYALDKPGLILANQGETIADYLKQIPEPIFSADDDNVIPMLDGDWFTDDVTERFGQFLKVTFGNVHYEENLKFIEQVLGKDIRKYFLKDFYTDHLKRYKKRPIYWLFSSPNGTFNALIYMHRYRPDTVSVVLNDYLREFRTKLSAHKNHLEAVSISSNASAGEKTKALKDIESHRRMIDELDVYEREVLYPLATEQVEIDLDDGVKVNYQKFGEALKKIPGLAAKED